MQQNSLTLLQPCNKIALFCSCFVAVLLHGGFSGLNRPVPTLN
jgi:hypothetical protein